MYTEKEGALLKDSGTSEGHSWAMCRKWEGHVPNAGTCGLGVWCIALLSCAAGDWGTVCENERSKQTGEQKSGSSPVPVDRRKLLEMTKHIEVAHVWINDEDTSWPTDYDEPSPNKKRAGTARGQKKDAVLWEIPVFERLVESHFISFSTCIHWNGVFS